MLKIRYLNTEHSSSSLFFCALYKCSGYNPKPKSKPADFPSSYMVLWTSYAGRENLQTNCMEAARDMSVVKGHARTQRPVGRSRQPCVPPQPVPRWGRATGRGSAGAAQHESAHSGVLFLLLLGYRLLIQLHEGSCHSRGCSLHGSLFPSGKAEWRPCPCCPHLG